VRTFVATKHPVTNRGVASDDFLNAIIDTALLLPDEVFMPNAHYDIYSALAGALGPWTGLLHRKAAMCEAARVTGMFESSGNWNEGVDATNPSSMHNVEGQETGIFQVSHNSINFDPSLRACVVRYCDSDHPLQFIVNMKRNHRFAVEYFMRLVRFSIAWDGPIKRGEVAANVRRDAVAEFAAFLS
jgi:hypothetical protein